MEDKFYYYISSRSSLGVIKKGTGVSKNEEDAIINYMVYGDFDEKISELLVANKNGKIKYQISKKDMYKLEANSNNCYLYLIRKGDNLVDKNMILTKDSSVMQRIEITDIIDRIKRVVDINGSKPSIPVKIKEERELEKVSAIELLFYAKEKLISFKKDVMKKAEKLKTKELELTDVDYVFDDEIIDDLSERKYIKIRNNKVS